MRTRTEERRKRARRVRAKIFGSAARPRLVLSRSLTRVSAQVIDDAKGMTLVSVFKKGANKKTAEEVGRQIAALCQKKHITSVVFDRAGHRYHGAVKVLADAARAGGLVF